MHSPGSSRDGTCSHGYFARCSRFLCQHVWGPALWYPAAGFLASCNVSSSHRASLPLSTSHLHPQGLSLLTGSRYPVPIRATSGICCFLPVSWLLYLLCLANEIPTTLQHLPGYLCNGSFWTTGRIYPLAADNWGDQEVISEEGKAADLFGGKQRKGIRNNA